MSYPKTVLIGDRVRWTAASGTHRGEVTGIDYKPNAAGDVVPWVVIRHYRYGRPTYTRIADTALEMMQFKVIFRDVDIQIALGDKVVV